MRAASNRFLLNESAYRRSVQKVLYVTMALNLSVVAAKLIAGFMAIAGLTSLGLPGLSGFVAEFHIFVGLFEDYEWAGVLAVITATITAAYILRMLAMAFFGPFNERWDGLPDMRPTEVMGATLLVAMILFMGLWPDPFVDRISSAVGVFPGIES